MIINKDEYHNTLSLIIKFRESRDLLLSKKMDFITELELQGINSTIAELNKEVEIFEKILNREITLHNIDSLHNFHKVFLVNMIQQELTNLDMANVLDITEDEFVLLLNNDFYGISKDSFMKICTKLDIQVNDKIYLFSKTEQISSSFEKINQLRISPQLLTSVLGLKVSEIRSLLKKSVDEGLYVSSMLFDKLRVILGDYLNQEAFSFNDSLSVAFKKPVSINEKNLDFATAFAGYIATSVFDNYDYPTIKIPLNPLFIHDEIIKKYGSIDFDNCLRYIWGIGIPVIPLNLSSGFHGACFKRGNKVCITLNQQNKSVSRWKFDLLHELYHALTLEENAYIEVDDDTQNINDEEERASQFAHYIVFGSEVESYLKLAVERADEKVANLKRTLQEVANEYNLDQDDFSNYAAYRLQRQKISWWGVAKVLQLKNDNPREVALNVLQEYIELDEIDDFLVDLLFS